MRIIVTGASGFIGSHLSFALEQADHEVIPLDRQISHWHDLRYPEIVEARFEENSNADLCIHLAAKVGRLFGEDDPMETVSDNVGMTALVAKECGKHGIRMAYASTSEVYGDNGSAVCDEDMGPFARPHNLYGISKFFGEEICSHYAGEKLLVFRFSMPYGPGLPAGRGRAAIINMLHQAKHHKKIPVHQGAERSWCYIADTIRAVLMIIEGGYEGAWNIGRDDAAVPMLEVARLACDLVGAPRYLIEEVPPPRMQTVVKRLSTEKLRGIGWRPEIELKEGMERTLAWVETLDAEGAVAA